MLTRIKTSIVDVVDELLQRLDVLDGRPQRRHLRALRAGRQKQLGLNGAASSLEKNSIKILRCKL